MSRKVDTVLLAQSWPTLAHASIQRSIAGTDMARKKRQPGTFGAVETLPSGRHRARYRGPDGRRYTAPTLFLTKRDARGWLSLRQADIIKGNGCRPSAEELPQAQTDIQGVRRHVDRAARPQRQNPRALPELLDDRTRARASGRCRSRRSPPTTYGPGTRASATRRRHCAAHCYGLLRTIMGTALSDGKIRVNPCVIRGAGSARWVHKIRPASA